MTDAERIAEWLESLQYNDYDTRWLAEQIRAGAWRTALIGHEDAERKLRAIRGYIDEWIDGDDALHALGHVEVLVRASSNVPTDDLVEAIMKAHQASWVSEGTGTYLDTRGARKRIAELLATRSGAGSVDR
jgi:hypothetical protein